MGSGVEYVGGRARKRVDSIDDEVGFDGLPAPLLTLGEAGVVRANRAACSELGRSREELVGDGLVSSLRPENRAELRQVLDRAGGRGAGMQRLTVQRPNESEADEFFELRIDLSTALPVEVSVIDTTEVHRLDAAVAALGNATIAIDSSLRLVWRPFGDVTRHGVADEQVLGARVLEWAHPDELPLLLEQMGMMLHEPGRKQSGVFRMRHPYIEGGWLRTRLTAVNCTKDPALRAVLVRTEDVLPVDVVEDITGTTGPFHSLAESAPVGIVVTDRRGAVLYRNELAGELLDLDHDIVGRTDWLSHLGSQTVDELGRALTQAREDLVQRTAVVPIERHGTRSRFVRIDAMPQLDEQGRAFGVVATLLDVTSETEARTALSEARDRLWHLATHDSLTNLANRVLFRERLERALAGQAKGDRVIALLYCDLNRFKDVNDRLGHGIGDLVLKIVAQRLSGVVRGSDLVGRYGGDEFLVLCQGFSDRSDVQLLAQRLVEAVEAPIRIDNEQVAVGMTVGVAVATGGVTADDLISEGDRNMYEAKAAGSSA